MASGKRPQIGDIVEITTSKGLAYALYSHEHDKQPRMGSLLRVLPGLFSKRPETFSEMTQKKEQFAVFFPLRAAVKQGIVQIIAHEKLPDWAIRFPVFRNGLPDRYGKVHDWWLWDGEKEWKVGKLTPEMRLYPDLGVVNDTRLIEMIEAGYNPENDV
jgi:hypothetical protein